HPVVHGRLPDSLGVQRYPRRDRLAEGLVGDALRDVHERDDVVEPVLPAQGVDPARREGPAVVPAVADEGEVVQKKALGGVHDAGLGDILPRPVDAPPERLGRDPGYVVLDPGRVEDEGELVHLGLVRAKSPRERCGHQGDPLPLGDRRRNEGDEEGGERAEAAHPVRSFSDVAWKLGFDLFKIRVCLGFLAPVGRTEASDRSLCC
ncbi:hypothetical protein THAOC_17204, partial [Thalassiosira oceanica]